MAPGLGKTSLKVAILCLAVGLISGKGIGSEAVVSMNGDMPRYLMNGVFFHDLLRDAPTTEPMQYARRYFARYPALSLGHHPLLLPIAEAPFYAVFGISVASGRLTVVVFLMIAGVVWFRLTTSVFDESVAFFSSLLFLSSPVIVDYSRIVMSEIPTLALVIVTAFLLLKFIETDRNAYLVAFVLAMVAACYSKQTAIFFVPTALGYLVLRRGRGSIFSRRIVLAFAALGVLLLPLVAITLSFSPTNVGFVVWENVAPDYWGTLTYFAQAVWREQLSIPVAVLAFASMAVSLIRRDGRATFFLLWIASTCLLVLVLGLHDQRIGISWVPAFTVFAAASPHILGSARHRPTLSWLVVALSAYQIAAGYLRPQDSSDGYEEAAEYVVTQRKGETVLYSSNIDTGYFVFFARKNDPEREVVVLRANKLLATSFLDWFKEERVTESEEIYAILDELGTCHVVIEDGPSESAALNLLRTEVTGERFELKKTITIRSTDERLRGVNLRIYEYKDCTQANLDAVLDIDIPLMGDSILVRLGDVIGR